MARLLALASEDCTTIGAVLNFAPVQIKLPEIWKAMKYPPLEANPLCQCKWHPSRCFWCKHGHLVECHYPFTCLEAGCDHLEKYKLGPVQLLQAKATARKALLDGRLAPYYQDQDGNILVAEPKSSKPKT